MAKIEQKNYFTFVSGLNTEGGYLTSAPNTWSEGYNIVPDLDGSLARRKGLDLESGYILSSAISNTEFATQAQITEEWNSVAGSGSRNFLVVQLGSVIKFYDNSGGTVSSTEKPFSIDLGDYRAAGNLTTIGIAPVSVASSNGDLIIVSSDIDPILVTYNVDLDTITVTKITIKMRDFEGVNDGLAINTRPATLTPAHNYNLNNQGWDAAGVLAAYKAGSSGSLYPSNAQVWTAGKDSSDAFVAALLDKQDFGTSPAPKGRYILDVFYRDRSTVSGVVGLPINVEVNRPSCVAFFAGRAWYSGVKSESISTWVMFSQVSTNADNYGKCYQDADPTSEFISDLVATDGGIIPIQDAGTILQLLPLGNSIMVFCDNGIWQIQGLDSGFSADSYSVVKISSVSVVGPRAIVDVETTALFWGAGGIYTFSQEISAANITAGTFTVAPITDLNIQTLYSEIPSTSKANASGIYNQEDRIITWTYSSEASDGANYRFVKDTVLCYDIRLKIFYVHRIEGDPLDKSILDVYITRGASSSTVEYIVLDSMGNTVVDDLNNTVVAGIAVDTGATKTTKFFVGIKNPAEQYQFTSADMDNARTDSTQWKDWYTVDSIGEDVVPYMITGFDITGTGGATELHSTYLVAYMKRTELSFDVLGDSVNPSSVKMQARWDWSDTNASGRWSPEQQVYRHKRVLVATPDTDYDDGQALVVTKSKVRGYGRVVQYKWTGEPDKDFQLVGWAVIYIGEDAP